MSVQAITSALAFKGQCPSDKLLLLVLANYADADGRCWPSHSRLAEDTELSERTILTAFKRLEEAGALTRREQRRDDGSRSVDLITLTFGRGEKVAPRGEMVAGGGEAVAPGVGKQLRGGGEVVAPPTTFEPSSEPSKEPTPAAQPSCAGMQAELKLAEEPIEAAWKAFPAHSRRNSSRKKFDPVFRDAAKLAGGPGQVLDAIRRYAGSETATKDGGRFAKAADAWLRDGRWQSWLEADPAPATTHEPADPWPARMLGWDRSGYWNSDWGPKPGRPGCAAPGQLELRSAA